MMRYWEANGKKSEGFLKQTSRPEGRLLNLHLCTEKDLLDNDLGGELLFGHDQA